MPSRDDQSSRIVEPRAITRVGDATYLDAWCHTANGDRAFRLDRIVSATELDDAVSERAAEPRDLSGGWFRGDGETVAVTLRLQPDAQWVPEYYPVVESAPGPDGTLDVVIDVGERVVAAAAALPGGAARLGDRDPWSSPNPSQPMHGQPSASIRAPA